MTTQLIQLNSLDLTASNIWANLNDNSEFGYSDGADEEKYLKKVLTKAHDVSLDSAQLIQVSRDWVADYHLSAVRANLLKTLNFPNQAKILEVGCGCGALTRYLGEQGYHVDAVEGSAARAEISALRCKDLENVRIIQHNFNTLNLPDGHYDVILFIGVLEYALRFIDITDISAEQAVISLLKKAAISLIGAGRMVVAIENRTGFKYTKGAFEDHLALPDVGINDYKGYEFTGIKTYDSMQWQKIIDDAGLKHRFFFPFADYKFPNMVINGDVDESDVGYLSNQIHSHDPISPWQPQAQENQQWANIIVANDLSLSSNSFGLVVTKSDSALENIFNSDWRIFDKVQIKPALRIDLTNKNEYSSNNNGLRQVINATNELNNSLDSIWRRQISKNPTVDTVMQLTLELINLLKKFWPQQKLADFDQFFITDDLAQLNFSRFWQTQSKQSATQQLFHFLLEFCVRNKTFLSGYRTFNYLSISELLQHCLSQNIIDCAQPLTLLASEEQQFRNQIHISPLAVEDDLNYMFSTHDKYQFKHVTTQLFYSWQADGFTADQSITERVKQGLNTQSLMFMDIDSNHNYLRFDPCDHEYGNGYYFCIHSINIRNSDHKSILCMQNKSLAECITASNDLDLIDKSRLIYKVDGIDSQIKFSLAPDLTKITDRYNLEIKLQWLGV